MGKGAKRPRALGKMIVGKNGIILDNAVDVLNRQFDLGKYDGIFKLTKNGALTYDERSKGIKNLKRRQHGGEIYTVLREAVKEINAFLYDSNPYEKRLTERSLISHLIQHEDEKMEGLEKMFINAGYDSMVEVAEELGVTVDQVLNPDNWDSSHAGTQFIGGDVPKRFIFGYGGKVWFTDDEIRAGKANKVYTDYLEKLNARNRVWFSKKAEEKTLTLEGGVLKLGAGRSTGKSGKKRKSK